MKTFDPLAITEPVYVRARDDVLVIGVGHHFDIRDNETAAKKFSGAIRSLDNLLTERGGGAVLKQWGYERYAASIFKGKPIDLEEGVNRVELLGSYGVTASEYALLVMMHAYRLHLGKAPDIAQTMLVAFENARLKMPEYSDFNTEKTFFHFLDLSGYAEDSGGGSQLLIDMFDLWSLYKGCVRDESLIGPNSEQMCSQLSGDKGILLGSAHLQYVVAYLKGEPVIAVPKWIEHIESLEPKFRHAFEEFRRIAA